MHKEILSKEQIALLPVIREFKKNYYLAGGTAIALYLGHRRSIDFDLFTRKNIQRKRIKQIFDKQNIRIKEILYEAHDQIHFIANDVKLTFFQYPHTITPDQIFEKIIPIPSLLDLAAMKAHALGGRAKWKDYVDLYYLLKDHVALKDVSNRAEIIFGNYFSGKLFREQLSFFDDIDYRESIDFMGSEIEEKEIKDFLVKAAMVPF